MTVQLWISQEFDTTHERIALRRFWNDMEDRFGQSDDLYLVLVNYSIGGRQVDLTVLKRDAIIVIELKECTDPFRATENGAWLTIPGGRVGTGRQNPFQQARDYRFLWVNFLQDKQSGFLPPGKAESMDFYHVSAFVAISPSLHPDPQNEIRRALWFRLVGLDQLTQAVYQQTSRKLHFTNQELKKLVTDVLHLRQVRPDDFFAGSLTARWEQYCRTLLDTHKDWTGMPPRLYISPDKMDIAPARVILCQKWPDDVLGISQNVVNQIIALGFSDLSWLVPASKPGLSEGVDLLQFVDECRRPLVLLGDPGMGKSVALERLALKYAERYVNDDGDYVPVLVRLRQYNSQKRDLCCLVRVALRGVNLSLDERGIEEVLQTEKLLLLFDGLDEALRDRDVVPAIETFRREYPQHRYVISCRAKAYEDMGNRIEGCEEVSILRLKPEEAATLWNSAVEAIQFDDLSYEIQGLLQTPLLLHLSPYAVKAQQEEIRTKSQLVDSIVRELIRTLGTLAGDIVERCLFRVALQMQGDGKYTIVRGRVFDIVAEYLEGESVAYQQEVAAAVLAHPMLIAPDLNIYSFWHPALQEYFAARGLQDAVLRQEGVSYGEIANRMVVYLRNSQWHETISYLAGFLGKDDVTKLIEYLLDFNQPYLAMVCALHAKSLQDGMVETVVNQVLEIVKAFSYVSYDAIQGDSIEELGMYLWRSLENEARHLSGALGNFIYTLSIAVVRFELEAHVEPELQSMLQSQDEIRRMIALYWLNVLIQQGASFSHRLVEITVANVLPRDFTYSWAGIGLFALMALPKMANREEYIPQWEKVLHSEEVPSIWHLLAVLALRETEGDEALRLLRYSLGNEDPQVRLVAVWEMTRGSGQSGELLRMVRDPNPIVAHEAALLLTMYYWDHEGEGDWLDDFAFAPVASSKLEFERLVTPLLGKIPYDMLSEQFAVLDMLIGPLDYLVKPLEHKNRIHVLLDSIYQQWCCYTSYSWTGSEIGAGPAIASAIWQVVLADLSGGFNDVRDTSELSLKGVKLADGGRLIWAYRELTDANIAYIKEWTDHEKAREVATLVLSGCYNARREGAD
jgi:KaiC/GvpD/RAD55 family RecA-like ATPase